MHYNFAATTSVLLGLLAQISIRLQVPTLVILLAPNPNILTVPQQTATPCTPSTAYPIEDYIASGSAGGSAPGKDAFISYDIINTAANNEGFTCSTSETCLSVKKEPFSMNLNSGEFHDGAGTTGNAVTGEYVLGDGRKGNLLKGPHTLPEGGDSGGADVTSGGGGSGSGSGNGNGASPTQTGESTGKPTGNGGSGRGGGVGGVVLGGLVAALVVGL